LKRSYWHQVRLLPNTGNTRRRAQADGAVYKEAASTSGKLVMGTLSAAAEMERDILVERTHAGLARARFQDKATLLDHAKSAGSH
jgi:DNA invertase Pin-like site-specific DNA recombinase